MWASHWLVLVAGQIWIRNRSHLFSVFSFSWHLPHAMSLVDVGRGATI